MRCMVKLGSLNIRNGRKGNLEAALRAFKDMNIGIGLLSETKIVDESYTRGAQFGYTVMATAARSRFQGGVALVYQTTAGEYSVESVKHHGPDVLSWLIVTGSSRFLCIGGYNPPGEKDGKFGEAILAAGTRYPSLPIILMGDLNFNWAEPRNEREADLVGILSGLGLSDGLSQFKQRRKFADCATWKKNHGNFVVKSRPDYIMGPADKCVFRNVQIKRPRYVNTDHHVLVATCRLDNYSRHRSYVKRRSTFPLTVDKSQESGADRLFEAVREFQPKHADQGKGKQPVWISDKTWGLMEGARQARKSSDLLSYQCLRRQLHRSLIQDRKARIERAGHLAESQLDAGEMHEAWKTVQCWYRFGSGRATLPSFEDMKAQEEERRHLYAKEDPLGESIPVVVAPFDIIDSVPDEDEIEAAVLKTRLGRSPGPSGMRAEDIRCWLHQARRETDADPVAWHCFCALVKHVFASGEIPQGFHWSTTVQIPKGGGEFRGIGLLEVAWKVCAHIINSRLKTIEFHPALHGFRAKRGTGTAILEAVLRMHLALLRQRPLYQVFVDLKKAYDTVDRERLLGILEGYGVGPNLIRLLGNYWSKQRTVLRQSSYYSRPIPVERGVTQGDVVSPTLFNILVDAIVRYWETTMDLSWEEISSSFYADDGHLFGDDPKTLQEGLDFLLELFERVGLKANARKTKSMCCHPGNIRSRMSSPAYKRKFTGEGESSSARKRQVVECEECGRAMQRKHLASHRKRTHGLTPGSRRLFEGGQNNDRSGLAPTTYVIDGPGGICPVPGCLARLGKDGNSLRRHFHSRHHYHLVRLRSEQGDEPFPRCDRCFLQVASSAVTHHQRTQTCSQSREAHRKHEAIMAARFAGTTQFRCGGQNIEAVPTFQYLGRILADDGKDWPAIWHNLRKARQSWARIARVLARDGANPRVSAYFYQAVVQSVLLYGCETWTMDDQKARTLSNFHHASARRLSGQCAFYNAETGTYERSHINRALGLCGLRPIEDYITRRRRYLEDFIATHPLIAICEAELKNTVRKVDPSKYIWTMFAKATEES